MSDTDEEIKRVLEGNIDRYGEVVRNCQGTVKAVLSAMVPDQGRVEDLAQETFLTAYRKLRDYRHGSSFSAWIRVIARNMALNERRGWIRKMRVMDRNRAEVEEAIEAQLTAAVKAMPDNILAAVSECMEKLDARERTLIEGFYFKGLSAKELAEKEKMSEGAVRVALHRARESMACLLKSDGYMKGRIA